MLVGGIPTFSSEKWWTSEKLGWWNSQYDGKVIKAMFQSPTTRAGWSIKHEGSSGIWWWVHGGYMELIIHFNRNFHYKPTNQPFLGTSILKKPMYIYIYTCCIYMYIHIYVNTNHLIIWVHKTSSSSTRPGSPGYRNPPQRLPIHWLFSPGWPRPGNQTRRWRRWVLRDWWLSHLPLVGNILLILMVNIHG